MREKEIDAVTKMKKCLPIETMLPGTYIADFAQKLPGGVLGVSWTDVSTAQQIFVYQMIAIATIKEKDQEKLPRVLALLLAGGILLSDLDIVSRDNILNAVFNDSQWGQDLLSEFRLNITDEAKYATACIATEYAWDHTRYDKESEENPYGEPLKVEGDSEIFLQRITSSKAITCARVGWRKWGVSGPSSGDSLADYTVLSELYAIILNRVYGYGFDNDKLIEARCLDHLSCVDIPPYEMPEKEHLSKEFRDFYQLTWKLPLGTYLDKVFYWNKSVEHRFARFVDSVGHTTTNFVAKYYDSLGLVNMDDQSKNTATDDKDIKALVELYHKFDKVWIRYSMDKDGFDSTFMLLMDFLMDYALPV